MTTVPFLDLTAQYESLKPAMDEAIASVITEAAFIGGRRVSEFESAFARFQSAAHCVGVGNGTDAIEIVLEALDLPIGSEVIVPANSFIASSEAVTRCGHTVVFADVDDTYTLNVQDVERRITPKTAAIIAVHLYGQPAAMEHLQSLATRYGLAIVEDCAQAHGAEYHGRRVGAIGVAGTFSFYPGKVLGAYGDAGAITTNDAVLAQRCRQIANHGRTGKYDHAFEGRNSRIDGLQSAVLSVKLGALEGWLLARRSVAAAYDRGLSDLPWLTLQSRPPHTLHAYHLYVLRTAQRDALGQHLKERGVSTGIHYPVALPQLEAYREAENRGEATPNATAWADEVLSLPIGEHMGAEQTAHVIESVRSFRS